MEKEIYLKDIRHERNSNERVCDWEYIEVPNHNVRVYYKANEEIGLGFNFYELKILVVFALPNTIKIIGMQIAVLQVAYFKA